MDLIVYLFNTLFTYPILNALMEIYHLLGDFGLSIVTLTGIVFLLTFPFTWKQLKQARATQSLQPQMAEINRRHAKDPIARTKAQHALYKEHGISLTSSFGPLLIQGTILSGLFFALNSVLRNGTLSTINRIMYPFLVHFGTLPDLNLTWFTIFNAVWHISLGDPDPTHILPLLTGLVTFAQMRMAQPIVQTGQTFMQTTQAMQFILLLLSVGITVFFAWQFAAGVTLYRLAWLVLSMIQRYFATGWGSLGVMPSFAVSGSRNTVSESHDGGTKQTLLRSSHKTRQRRASGASTRRRGRHRKRGR